MKNAEVENFHYSACRNEHVFEHGCVQRITHPVHALLRQDDTHGTSSLRLQDRIRRGIEHRIQRGIEDRIQRGIEDLGDFYLRFLACLG